MLWKWTAKGCSSVTGMVLGINVDRSAGVRSGLAAGWRAAAALPRPQTNIAFRNVLDELWPSPR
jgi:hypothetical protein